jgi:hypothetical protein
MNWFSRLLFATRNEPSPVNTEPYLLGDPWAGDYRVITTTEVFSNLNGEVTLRVTAVVEEWEAYKLLDADCVGYRYATTFQRETPPDYVSAAKTKVNASADKWIEVNRNLGEPEVRYVQ